MVATAPTLTPCKLCGTPTTGSVGAAGLRWPFLCQPCKDAEDAALVKVIAAMGDLHDKGTDRLLANVYADDHSHAMLPERLPLVGGGQGKPDKFEEDYQ